MGIAFGRYELIRKIASGGMGQVLLARKGAKDFEKLVVIKRILPHLVEDEEFFAMFIDEAKLTMRLDHPNIARINEFGAEQGVHFIEMEYVAGEDLRRLDRRARLNGKPLPLGVIVRCIADAAAGLDFAHKARDTRGVPMKLVHRDVSPQNILVGFDGAVKLIDFGVAKAVGRIQHTASGILKGKYAYMSPEQTEGREVDARSDIFSLGIIVWELLTARRLFRGETDVMTQRLVSACQVPAPSTVEPSVPASLDALVLRALQKDPGQRYPDAAAFRMALEEYALAHALPASTAHLVSFMQELYAERIAREADPRALEEDSSLTGPDAGSLGSGAHGTPSTDSERDPPAPGRRQTQPLSASRPGRARRTWLAVGGVVVVVMLGVGVAMRRHEAATTRRELQPPHVEPVAPAPLTRIELPPERAGAATFEVSSEPGGAEVELAGEKKGRTPLQVTVEATKLPSLLTVSLEGYEVVQVTLSESSPTAVTATLKKKSATGPRTTSPSRADIKTTR